MNPYECPNDQGVNWNAIDPPTHICIHMIYLEYNILNYNAVTHTLNIYMRKGV